jgi:hypothetical protein
MNMDFRKILDLLNEEKTGKEKIDRSAFIYLAPKSEKEQFAQCATCVAFLPGKERCAWFSKNDKVIGNASCSLYVNGEPNDDQEIRDSVTPEEAGYVEGQVRCENCTHVKGDTCTLFQKLNQALPDLFELDSKIEDKACCNAWQKYEEGQ